MAAAGPAAIGAGSRLRTASDSSLQFTRFSTPTEEGKASRMLHRSKHILLAGTFATMLAGATVAGASVASAAGTLSGNAEIVNPSNLTPLASGTQNTAFQVRTKPLGGKCQGNSAQ